MNNDPTHLAYLLRWSREHHRDDPTQPRDLDNLLLRAAGALETVTDARRTTRAAWWGIGFACGSVYIAWVYPLLYHLASP